MKWGIYITYGFPSEFEAVKKATFATKKEALRWAKQNDTPHTYPQKCVMRISEILERDADYYN